MILKVMYSVFIGILFATFVGVGIAAFYPQPKSPEYPASLSYPKPVQVGTESAELMENDRKAQEEFDAKNRDFQKINGDYNRNVSIIALTAAVLALVVSLTLFKKLLLIADGLLLGGVLTLLYSIARWFAAGDNMFRFIVVTISFAVSLTVGYVKFIKKST